MATLPCKVSIDLRDEQRREYIREAEEGAKDTRQSQIFDELGEWIETEVGMRKKTICFGISPEDLFIDILEQVDLSDFLDKWKDDQAKMIVEEEWKQ